MEKNNAYVEVLAKIASLMGRTKESIQMSSSNTHTSITMFAENNSKIIGNWYFDSSDSKELMNASFNGLKALVESLSTIRAMTDKQRKYIESLVKKVFRNADSQSEILSRLDRVKISSQQASVMIHALKLECNIGRSVPAYMLMANNLNPKMDEFFSILGYDE